jgi:hypothetical protein
MQVVSHAGRTVAAVFGIFTGALSEFETGLSLVDRFKNLNYRTAVISAQNEGFGKIAQMSHMDRADLFVDSTRFPRELRMYASLAADEVLTMPSPVITRKFEDWLKDSDADKPFFAYLNVQEMHFPYYYKGASLELTARPALTREMIPENKERIRETYLDAARRADHAIADIMARLDKLRLRENTLVVIVGDHGEELFDSGYLGHAVSVNYEEYSTVGKLINSGWKVPAGPIGTRDLDLVIYNSLLRSPADALPTDPEVLCYLGYPDKPGQIGLVTSTGLVRYDFKKNAWNRQAGFGGPILPAQPSNHLIHVWESYVIKRLPKH